MWIVIVNRCKPVSLNYLHGCVCLLLRHFSIWKVFAHLCTKKTLLIKLRHYSFEVNGFSFFFFLVIYVHVNLMLMLLLKPINLFPSFIVTNKEILFSFVREIEGPSCVFHQRLWETGIWEWFEAHCDLLCNWALGVAYVSGEDVNSLDVGNLIHTNHFSSPLPKQKTDSKV